MVCVIVSQLLPLQPYPSHHGATARVDVVLVMERHPVVNAFGNYYNSVAGCLACCLLMVLVYNVQLCTMYNVQLL